MEFNVKEFKELIEEQIQEKLELNIDTSGDIPTFFFENNNIQLSVCTQDDIFTILNIEITNQGEGTGSTIYESIEEFCVDNGYSEIIANKVKSSAIPFWENFDFEETGEDMIKYL